MRLILSFYFFLVSAVCFAQADSVSLKEAISNLDKALVNKDEKTLVRVLHDDVTFGHSNAWVQNKSDILNDMKSGKLSYEGFENASLTIVALTANWATVRIVTTARGRGTSIPAFETKLHILQVWLYTKDGWQLLARQSTKL